MPNTFCRNHYVPEWYQKRFIPTHQKERVLYLLDMQPGSFIDGRGISHPKRAVHRLGPSKYFVEADLYTTQFGGISSTAIEQAFFGEIDTNGRAAVEYLSNFQHPSVDEKAFRDMVVYMSTQKLRTPKGLGWLSHVLGSSNRNQLLIKMTQLRELYGAIWTECIWQIADAANSDTKLIISDHPVTVYNRSCGPRSQYCRQFDDPDIRFAASHTLFPLSLEKILILTNVTWVRNPYQPERKLRPNPEMFRSAMFDFTAIQTMRHLAEQEVREINFIIKSRAYRYIAAGKEDWLYPEKYVSRSDWAAYGNGYLLMPDPRSVVYTTGIVIGYKDGGSAAFDAYGRRPGEEGFNFDSAVDGEFDSLLRFQGEFAALVGPVRRGRAFNSAILDPEQDSDEYYQVYLKQATRRRRQR